MSRIGTLVFSSRASAFVTVSAAMGFILAICVGLI